MTVPVIGSGEHPVKEPGRESIEHGQQFSLDLLTSETAKKLADPTEAEFAALQLQAKALMRAIAYVDAETPRLDKEARAAFGKKDPNALSHARSILIDWLMVRDDVAAVRLRVEDCGDADADVDRGRKARLQSMADDLVRASDILRRLDKTVRELVALA